MFFYSYMEYIYMNKTLNFGCLVIFLLPVKPQLQAYGERKLGVTNSSPRAW